MWTRQLTAVEMLLVTEHLNINTPFLLKGILLERPLHPQISVHRIRHPLALTLKLVQEAALDISQV